MQPIQQQGRRFPCCNSAMVRSMWFFRVAACLTVVAQQIHSLRARGVISFQAFNAAGRAVKACFKPAGSLCTVPPGICLVFIQPYYSSFRKAAVKAVKQVALEREFPAALFAGRGAVVYETMGQRRGAIQEPPYDGWFGIGFAVYEPLHAMGPLLYACAVVGRNQGDKEGYKRREYYQCGYHKP